MEAAVTWNRGGILGQPTQSDSSWHTQMSPVGSPGCAAAVPGQSPFPDVTKGDSLRTEQHPWATICHSWVHSPRQVGLHLSPLFLSDPLFSKNVSIHASQKEILPYSENFLDSGSYSMPRAYNNTIYRVAILYIISFNFWNNPTTWAFLLPHFTDEETDTDTLRSFSQSHRAGVRKR